LPTFLEPSGLRLPQNRGHIRGAMLSPRTTKIDGHRACKKRNSKQIKLKIQVRFSQQLMMSMMPIRKARAVYPLAKHKYIYKTFASDFISSCK
jgi:hypothetical protein